VQSPPSTLLFTRFRTDRPASGAALRNAQNLWALSLMGPVDVICTGADDSPADLTGIREWFAFSTRKGGPSRPLIARFKTRLWPFRPGVHPTLDASVRPDVIRSTLRLVAERQYALAVVEELALCRYIGPLKAAGCRVVFDDHNVEATLRAQIAAARKHQRHASSPGRVRDWLLHHRLAQEEKRAIQSADMVWACSNRDASVIQETYGAGAKVTVVPNCVRVEAYQRAGAHPVAGNWDPHPITLVFPATFSYYPNEEAALRLTREILPALQSRQPEARVLLVGRDPTPALQLAAAEQKGVTVTGPVESILPFLEGPCVVTLPITSGSGTRLKILEAFAVGRPVVTTRKGAEGIDGEDGRHFLVRETSGEMCAAVLELWSSPTLRERLCSQALDLVRNQYSWEVAAGRISTSLGWDSRLAH
jgi:glycosyltransferase involved in cell wall biosynthesis